MEMFNVTVWLESGESLGKDFPKSELASVLREMAELNLRGVHKIQIVPVFAFDSPSLN